LRGKHLNSGIRGGLWEEQHFQGMGPAVWLFGWLVHRQTRERDGVGLVLAGSPLTYQIIGEDTGIAERTLKRWMARLVRAGYVQIRHGAHRRMIIQIAKAKKFGPQQLGFPQKQFGFPQAPFFAPKSKGPVLAPNNGSKGPIVAPESVEQFTKGTVNKDTYACPQPPHRNLKPERKETSAQLAVAADSALGEVQTPRVSSCEPKTPVKPPQRGSASAHYYAASSYFPRSWPDKKALREMELRAELRVGAGPEIRRE
jgi:hypothetical protein